MSQLLTHSSTEPMRRFVRSRRKLTLHAWRIRCQPTETCLVLDPIEVCRHVRNRAPETREIAALDAVLRLIGYAAGNGQ
jgi:hypothetical protein